MINLSDSRSFRRKPGSRNVASQPNIKSVFDSEKVSPGTSKASSLKLFWTPAFAGDNEFIAAEKSATAKDAEGLAMLL